MRAGNGVARNRFWLGVDVRGVEALRVQVEVHFGYLRVDLLSRPGQRRSA